MKKSFFLLTLLGMAACSAKLVAPTQMDVDRVSTKYPGYTLSELNEGKSQFEHTCNRCHGLKNPRSKSEEKWKEIVPVMVGKLKKKYGDQAIDDKQQESILKYLVTMSGK
jgi:hypothetical protein